ncbi:MAG TPA: MerR family transcriptional regulator [Actinomycetota bacterium]|nr:MerR family transcriptional regulator [Actinomycetota bacterium]
MRYRVEQLASECDVSVDTIRYYQSLGLLPPPERRGRVAWYGPEHARRIREVRALQRKGLTLAAIRRVVQGELGRADADLAAAVAAARGEGRDEELLTLEQFAQRSGVPASLIQAVEREGIRIGRRIEGEDRYTTADIEMVRAALRLLEFGLPLGELLSLARDTHGAMLRVAERAVELFDEHVRKPIRDTAESEDAAAAQLVDAFRVLLPAVTSLVANHFRRVLLGVAEEHIERVGGAAEVQAAREESRRMDRAWGP